MGAEQSEQAIKRILGEAVQMGVDESQIAKMPQEMQRFTAEVIEMATKTGGFSEGAANIFSSGVLDFTSKGLEGARSAAEVFSQKASATGGIEGQIGIRTASKVSKELGLDLNYKQLSYLSQLDPSNLKEGDFQAIAKSFGTDENTIKKATEMISIEKQTSLKSTDESLNETKQALDEIKDPKQKRAILEKIQKGEAFKEGDKDYEMGLRVRTAMEGAKQGLYNEGQTNLSPSRILQLSQVEGNLYLSEEEKKKRESAAKPATDKQLGTIQQQSQAIGDATRLDALRDYSSSFIESAGKLSKGAVEFEEQFNLFKEAIKKGAEGMDDMASFLANKAKQIENNEPMRSGGFSGTWDQSTDSFMRMNTNVKAGAPPKTE
jgi:hypothetical protein